MNHTMTQHPNDAEGGFNLIEVMIAFVFLVIGLLGFVQTIISAQTVARSTRELNIANAAIVNVVEEFHYDCGLNFDEALTVYGEGKVTHDAPGELGARARITTTLLLDEPGISPPTDLNGDGDYLDLGVDPTTVRVGVLRVTLSWVGVTGPRELDYTTMLARGES